MIGLALAFLAGELVACFLPDRFQGAVRGLGGWVWARVKPLPAPVTPVLYSASVGIAPRLNVGRAILNTFDFFARYWRVVLLVAVFIFVVSIFRGCVRFPFGESREHAQIRAELAQEEARTQVRINGRDATIADIRTHVATARVTLQHLQEQGHAEIAAVTPPTETPLDDALVGAWRSSLSRLRLYPDANGAGAHSGGSSTQS